ncbi:hypothetical protein MFRU_005g01820 [Monilinia fructicola]|nr:hypothetical protein MFRU_005g01820 [Monilinia fructicola]
MDAAVILGTSLHEPIGRIQRVSAVMLWCCQLNSIFSPESSAATVGTQAARITVRLASGGIKRFLVRVQKHAAHKVTPSGGLGRSWAAPRAQATHIYRDRAPRQTCPGTACHPVAWGAHNVPETACVFGGVFDRTLLRLPTPTTLALHRQANRISIQEIPREIDSTPVPSPEVCMFKSGL